MKENGSISPDQQNDVRPNEAFGKGNELFSELMEAHNRLTCRILKSPEGRRSWRQPSADGRNEDNCWGIPDRFLAKVEEGVRPGRVMEFYSIDRNPFLMVRIEGDDERGRMLSANAIVNRRYWAAVDFQMPPHGGQAHVDLGALKEQLDPQFWSDLRIDFDGVISNPIDITPDRFFDSLDICGGLTGISDAGVLRGWATNLRTPILDLPITVLIDNQYHACFFASEKYRDQARLKQFSIRVPRQFRDGAFHRLDLSVTGVDKSFQGAPIYFCFANRKPVILSGLCVREGRFFGCAASPGSLELFKQSALIDQSRIAEAIRLVRTPRQYIWTAAHRVLAKTRLTNFLAPKIPGVMIEQTAAYWSAGDAHKKQKIIDKLKKGGKKPPRLSPQPLKYQVKKNGGIISAGVINEPSSSNDSFSTGLDGLSFPIHGELQGYMIEFIDKNGSVLASAALDRLIALSEGESEK